MEHREYFDRVVAINLDRRPDRWERFTRAIDASGWPFAPPVRFAAVDGDRTGVPRWWRQGGGAWGCLMSHVRILEQAISDDVRRLLILEDDALPVPDFEARVGRFLRAVPSDWDALYLGGQHLAPPARVGNEVVRCRNVNRTHAHAMGAAYMRDAYRHILHVDDYGKHPKHHVDHQLGRLHRLWNHRVYAPAEFLIGQVASRSDILGRRTGNRFWNWGSRESQMKADVLLFTAFDEPTELSALLERWAVSHGFTFNVLLGMESWAGAAERAFAIREARHVFVWNGMDPGCDWVTRVCRRYGVPVTFVDSGLVPQGGHFHFDPSGIWDRSSLCGPPTWVGAEHRERLRVHRERFVEGAGGPWSGTADGPVIVPLQKEFSLGVYLQPRLQSMQALVEEVEGLYAGRSILLSCHPGDRDVQVRPRSAQIVHGSTTLDLSREASVVVGLNSTALLEAALIGAPVRALGACPLQSHADEVDDLLAACLARQVPLGAEPATLDAILSSCDGVDS